VIGIVTEREKNGLGRVKVKFPTQRDRVSDWCRVAVPFAGVTDAGDSYGHHWMPNEKDEVLVAHQEDDPKVPIVIGSVYSKKRTPPTPEPDERMQRSSSGQTILISDKSGSERILLETKKKQHLELRESDSTIVLANDHTITLSGDGKKISIHSKNGQEIVLDDGANETQIKAPKVVVTAQSIELKKG
jgi:uncharacterized protein involved in type VI secretion and phage assembly